MKRLGIVVMLLVVMVVANGCATASFSAAVFNGSKEIVAQRKGVDPSEVGFMEALKERPGLQVAAGVGDAVVIGALIKTAQNQHDHQKEEGGGGGVENSGDANTFNIIYNEGDRAWIDNSRGE